MHRFNAPTFTYVCGVCPRPQLHPRSPIPVPVPGPGPDSELQPVSHSVPMLIGVGVWCSTCLQIMFIHVYKPLTCTPRRTWNRELSTKNWELGMGSGLGLGQVVLGTGFWFCAPGCPPASTSASASSSHRQSLAFWLFGWVTVPTSFPLRLQVRFRVEGSGGWLRFGAWVRCALYVNLLTTIFGICPCTSVCRHRFQIDHAPATTDHWSTINDHYHLLIIVDHFMGICKSVENLAN